MKLHPAAAATTARSSLAALVLLLSLVGCSANQEPEQGEPRKPPATENEATPPPPTEPARGDALAPYAPHLLAHSLAVCVADPAALTAALAAELDLPDGGPLAAHHAALTKELGTFAEFLRPEGWIQHGLDSSRPLAVVLASGPRTALGAAFVALWNDLAGIEKLLDLVYDTGQASDAAADQKAAADAQALRPPLESVGLVARFIVPVLDAQRARKALDTAFAHVGFSKIIHPGSGGGPDVRHLGSTLVRLLDGEDAQGLPVLLVDVVWFPHDPRAHGGVEALLYALPTGEPSLTVDLPPGAIASLSLDPGDLTRLHYLSEIADGLAAADALRALARGKRADAGNRLLEELGKLKQSAGLLDELGRRGPFEQYQIIVQRRPSPEAPLRVVSRGQLRTPPAGLDSLAGTSPVSPAAGGEAFVMANIAAPVLAEDGLWREAGLRAGKWLSPTSLEEAARLDHLPRWMSWPPLTGLWLWALPEAAWRAHAPQDAGAAAVAGDLAVTVAAGGVSVAPLAEAGSPPAGQLVARLDVAALERAQGLSPALSPLLRTLSVDAVLHSSVLDWRLEVDAAQPLLLALHTVLGTLPAAGLPSLASTLGLVLEPAGTRKTARDRGERSATTTTSRAVEPDKVQGVAAVFEKNKQQVEKCARRVTQKFGAVSGRLSVEVTIRADGSVGAVDVVTDEIGRGLGGCVAQAIKEWRFEAQGAQVAFGKTWRF